MLSSLYGVDCMECNETKRKLCANLFRYILGDLFYSTSRGEAHIKSTFTTFKKNM